MLDLSFSQPFFFFLIHIIFYHSFILEKSSGAPSLASQSTQPSGIRLGLSV